MADKYINEDNVKELLSMTKEYIDNQDTTLDGKITVNTTAISDKVQYGTVTIPSTDWTALVGNVDYTYYCDITLDSSLNLGASDMVELVNDNPNLFMEYGFVIASIVSNTMTIYVVEEPATSVTLTFIITRNMKSTTIEQGV